MEYDNVTSCEYMFQIFTQGHRYWRREKSITQTKKVKWYLFFPIHKVDCEKMLTQIKKTDEIPLSTQTDSARSRPCNCIIHTNFIFCTTNQNITQTKYLRKCIKNSTNAKCDMN